MLHIDRSTEAAHILCDIIGEDDRAHRRLPRATLAHQEHLSLLLAGVHVVNVEVVAELGCPARAGALRVVIEGGLVGSQSCSWNSKGKNGGVSKG